MNRKSLNTFSIIFLLIVHSANVSSQDWRVATANDSRGFIVVTGMRINEDPANYGRDLSVAEGAIVKLTGRNSITLEKKTEVFNRPGQKAGEVFFTADFPVILDSTYNISMTFKNGTTIKIDGYHLPVEWKTHFYFHSTIGTVSPASVLRKKQDEQTKLWCYVYGLFPLDNYKKMGGTQVKK
jgi:hypothetical protein